MTSDLQPQWKIRALKWLRVLVWQYFTLLFAWAIAYALWGDGWWWLFMLNSLAVYLFFPLPIIFLIAYLLRKRGVWLATGLAFLLAALLFGKLYVPWRTGPIPPGQAITVMTYNVLGHNQHPDRVMEVILAADADVVALQELNPAIADAIRQTLQMEYPYQVLDPQDDVFGSGVISRYPLELSDEQLPGIWVGTPQVIHLTIGGKPVTILNAHAVATNLGTPEYLDWTIAERVREAQTIKDFVETHSEPLIVPIDFNATVQNRSYRVVTALLSDSWLEAGWGLGHTFPAGIDSEARMLLVRIDYVFYSRHFRATDVRVGPWDGFSDHRPVIARLILLDD